MLVDILAPLAMLLLGITALATGAGWLLVVALVLMAAMLGLHVFRMVKP